MSHEPQGGRKHLSGPEKLAILQAYLVERMPISDLCDEHGLQPSQIYYWQRQLVEQGAIAFDRKSGRRGQAASIQARKIAKLETLIAQKEVKLAYKNEVISELMEENVRAKKENGELGKLERWHGSLKRESIRRFEPQSLDEAPRLVTQFVRHYNDVRLHSAIC